MGAIDLQRDLQILSSYRYSSSVLAREMQANSIRDRLHLLTQAVRCDLDKNKYLKTSEIRSAVLALTQPTPEIGIISDIDRTLLPHSGDLQTLTAPFAGSAQLLDELEHEQGRKSGDMYYVTTRTPDVLGEVPEWLWDNRFPVGQIDTGVALQPWISQSEKWKTFHVSSTHDLNSPSCSSVIPAIATQKYTPKSCDASSVVSLPFLSTV